MSGLEFAYMEAALRARQRMHGASPGAGRHAADAGSLAECYAELEVDANITDQEVTKAYRRQMSRHHPDKLVATRSARVDGANGERENSAHTGSL